MNNPAAVSICAFLMLMVLLTWVGYRVFYKPGKFLKQLGRPVITADRKHDAVISDSGDEPGASTIVTVLQQIGSRMPSSDTEVATLRADLIRAGFRSETAVPVYYGIRIMATLAMLVIALMFEGNMQNQPPMMRVAMLFSACSAGWILPRFWLEKKAKKRQEILRLSLPDALDLLVVSVEAGLGLDQAIQHVARELQVSHPQLSEEMSLVTLEMRAGKRRSEALRNFAERCGESEVKKLVAILIQNDRFGTSMGESLRNHSDFLRTRRRQEAEERAGKVGVKLVFPIFFFILPSMLIVAAGPGILQIFKYLFPMMKSISG
ncbi:MAG TPA: type II secretion system F family protein [Candidatus Limnocylindrales bacterium]|nr:type II secretion system F family protein [Candidatus Limnocylindrales bacterium]